jgi:Immunity protein 30
MYLKSGGCQMNQNLQIDILKANRLMRSPDEAVAFEQALAKLAESPDPADLPQLHLILDDACQQPEVMFSLVHFLESFSLQDQLPAFVQTLPNLVKNASEWTTILHTRIINDAEAQAVFEEGLRSMSSQKREEICRLLALALARRSSESETQVA